MAEHIELRYNVANQRAALQRQDPTTMLAVLTATETPQLTAAMIRSSALDGV